MARTLSIDLETFSSVDIKKAGAYAYADSPDFEILIFAYSLNGAPVEVLDLAQGDVIDDELKQMILDPAITKIAYNANFERVCLAAHFKQEMPPDEWRCTAVDSSRLGLPGYLAGVAEALKLDMQKDTAGKALIKYFSVPCKPTKVNEGRTRNLPEHDPEKWQMYLDYCKRDVEVEMGIRDKISSVLEVTDFEQSLWSLDQRINDRGVMLDHTLVTQAIQCNKEYAAVLKEESLRITGLQNPNSVAQLSDWLKEKGLEVPNLQAETVDNLIGETDDSDVKTVLQNRRQLSKASIKKYQAMDNAECHDGRVKGLLQFYGAGRTGRWAGRIVQVQNLTKNYIPDIENASKLVKVGAFETLDHLFTETRTDILSQLVRTALVASPGHRLIVSDFSAIEARVIAWFAQEQWRLRVFETHGKIYEASAAEMFNVPIESIDKSSPLRAKGKVAELALGYQGGPFALETMGALEMGIAKNELQGLVDAWRASNPKIVQFWYACDVAAIEAVRDKTTVRTHGLVFQCTRGILFITLPSGRKLAYMKPRLEKNRFNRDSIVFEGLNDKRKWGPVETYGGKIVENCLSGDTLVLTYSGWIPLVDVQRGDVLWDGIEWVSHNGLIDKGTQKTIDLDGVRVTPEHLILTEEGWKDASSCEGLNREEVELPKGFEVRGVRREEVALGDPMRLRKSNHIASRELPKRDSEVLRMHEGETDFKESDDSRHVQTPGVRSVEIHAIPLQTPNSSSLAQLRSAWNLGLRRLARKLREFLGRLGTLLSEGFDIRTKRRERKLLSGELRMGNDEAASSKQEKQRVYRKSLGSGNRSGSIREVRNRRNDTPLSDEQQLSSRPFILQTGRTEQVYDLLNAGPRHRFTVLGESGPIIVHNCVQATARDLLAEGMLNVEAEGYKIVMHVHDELVTDTPIGFGSLAEVEEIMSRPIPWAEGLTLAAEGFETQYYKKD